MPSASALEGRATEVPAGFKFVLKAPQQITHRKRLKDVGLTADSSRLPVRTLDAMDTLQIEECRYNAALSKPEDLEDDED